MSGLRCAAGAALLAGRGSRLGEAFPGDAEVGEVEELSVPHDVVASAEQDEVVDGGGAAVGSGLQVVDVAEGGWSAAAFGGAAAVSGGDGAALRGGDLVGGGGEA